ncbi:hypothetical protein FOFC_08936 [Fusarium oxysporum]|nr:hypothetical protein FOFC_08936 [Fusarium oxysporum]
MSNSPLSPSPAGFPPTTLTPCPTPPSSVFSRLSQHKRSPSSWKKQSLELYLPTRPLRICPRLPGRTVASSKRIRWLEKDQPIGHVWCCNRCNMKGAAEFFSVQATSSAADHLRKAHRLTPASQSSESSPGDEERHTKGERKAIQELSVGFVIDSDVPFTIFEHSFLRKIFNHFDSDLVLQMAWSGSSVTREIHRLFEAKRDTIKAELRNALTAVHISFDLWTSPNRFAIMAVFAHFIDQLGHRQSRLLALRRQFGAHSGENLAGSLIDIVHEWEIEGRRLDPSMRPVDIKARRMRCYGHTLNLVARAFLFGKDASHSSWSLTSTACAVLLSRTWIIGAQRAPLLEVVMNNGTRWNSTYMMIKRALRKQTNIRAFLFAIQEEENEARRIPVDDILSSEDWRVLAK